MHKCGRRQVPGMSRLAIGRRGGFSLIEVMIVVLIISVLLAIAIPNFMRARERSRAQSCCANLRQIETGKEQYAIDNKLSTGDAIADLSLLCPNYVKQTPVCPTGGTYSVNTVGELPTCSRGGARGAYDYHGL